MKNLGDLNNWTKTNLARVIAQALVNADKPLPADHFRVKRIVQANSKPALVDWCNSAINALTMPSNA